MVKLSGREAYPFYFGASPAQLKLAAELRANMTRTEKVLWERLRNKKIRNHKFRRQHPIGEFIVDFFCYQAMLVIEIDGDAHNNSYQKERDIERTAILNDLGIRVIRFRNEEILHNIDSVMDCINEEILKEN